MLTALLIWLPFMASAQEDQIDATSVTKITLLTPGISRELKIGKKQTLHTAVLMNVIVQSVISSTFSETNVYTDPAITAGYRYYYNFEKRANRGKRYEKNSGNYVSAFSALVFTKARMDSDQYEETNRRAIGIFGTCWGFQRNYRGHFSLDLNLGLQYQFGKATFFHPVTGQLTREVTGTIEPGANLTLGIWLN
ncbi:MAG: DUF3575 domain-containing protein [Chitinophagaceae bacterium]|nr:DUF3575 domain-containing protein [Chitinophagaceae bacterium]